MKFAVLVTTARPAHLQAIQHSDRRGKLTCIRAPAAPRVSLVNHDTHSQNGENFSQIRVNQPFRWLSVRLPLERNLMVASATL